MKRFYLLFAIAIAILSTSVIFSSCSDDDGYSLGDIWYSKYATVNNIGEPIRSFTIGDSTILSVVASNIPNYIPKERRVSITYTILGDIDNGHIIKLNGIAEIPTKDVLDIEVNDLANLTRDPIDFKSLTISDQYVNLDFGFQYGSDSKLHQFDLYRIIPTSNSFAEADQIENDTIALEFVHNKNDDSEKWIRGTTRCYNLRSLNLAKHEKVTLKIKLNTLKGEKIVYADYTPF